MRRSYSDSILLRFKYIAILLFLVELLVFFPVFDLDTKLLSSGNASLEVPFLPASLLLFFIWSALITGLSRIDTDGVKLGLLMLGSFILGGLLGFGNLINSIGFGFGFDYPEELVIQTFFIVALVVWISHLIEILSQVNLAARGFFRVEVPCMIGFLALFACKHSIEALILAGCVVVITAMSIFIKNRV